ncbi:GNAT family N-acetyltransferase [Tabrizicola sp. WMC-M-20]|nr:GNAT family N-acetyltransferase [Tabrizicola sp. WMC-M-20]
MNAATDHGHIGAEGQLRIETRLGLAALAAVAPALEECLSRTGGDIYFAPGWVQSWAETWGSHGELRLVLAFDDAQLVGYLPFLVETLWPGPIPVRLARLAGTDLGHPVMGLPLPFATLPDLAGQCLQRMLAELDDVHAVAFSPLAAGLPGRDILGAGRSAMPFNVAADDQRHQFTFMPLPGSFDDWLNELSKSRRREYRKDLTALAEAGTLSSRRTTADTALRRLDAFADLHGQQWQAIGKAGHFGDWPDALPFARAAMVRLAPSGRAWIDEHWCGDTLLSAQYGFSQGYRTYWWLIGRTLDPDLAKLGVGRVGLVERVRDLITRDCTGIEAGAGEYDYKLSYGGTLVPMGRIVLAAPGALWRVQWLLRVCDTVDLLYYRIWFLKLAPRIRSRLGLRPRPLWRLWRRTRL